MLCRVETTRSVLAKGGSRQQLDSLGCQISSCPTELICPEQKEGENFTTTNQLSQAAKKESRKEGCQPNVCYLINGPRVVKNTFGGKKTGARVGC